MNQKPFFVTTTGKSVSLNEAREIKNHFMRIRHECEVNEKFSDYLGDMTKYISENTMCTAVDIYERGLDNSDSWNDYADHALEESEQEALYDITYALYRKDWIKSHSYTQEDMDKARADYDALCVQDHEMTPSDDGFGRYFLEHGFNGEIFVCREEFLNFEFLDSEYMSGLLGEIGEVFDLWKSTVGIMCD